MTLLCGVRHLKVNVKLFAGYRDKVGRPEVGLELPEDATVGLLAQEMVRRHPTLIRDATRLVVAVNQEFRDHAYALSDGDEVALIPPVSGGSRENPQRAVRRRKTDMIEVTYEPLDPEAITARVKQDTNGAVVTFLGTTRSFTGERRVLHLEYEAYRPMADNKLAEVSEEIRQRWHIQDIAISHRLGRLEIGEISLVVAIASPHRKDAFEACQYSVDRIKQIVPIWKKEFFEGGEVWVGSQEDAQIPGPVKVSASAE